MSTILYIFICTTIYALISFVVQNFYEALRVLECCGYEVEVKV